MSYLTRMENRVIIYEMHMITQCCLCSFGDMRNHSSIWFMEGWNDFCWKKCQ